MARKKLEDLNDEELKDLLEATYERKNNIRERVDELEYELARRHRETMAKVNTSNDKQTFQFYRTLAGDARKANS